jgi:two-component system aerobic respiration control sensor histidine kinase ArcB
MEVTMKTKNDIKQPDSNALLQTLPASVYWKDTNSVYLGCNEYMADMAGLTSPKDVIGKTDHDMPWKDQADFLCNVDKEVMESGKDKTLEEVGKLANGEVATFLTTKKPLRDNKGKIIGIYGLSVDISSHKLTESRLEQKKNDAERRAKHTFLNLEQIIACMPGSVFWKDNNGVYQGCNDEMAKLLRLPKSAILGKTDYDLAPKIGLSRETIDSLISTDKEIIISGSPRLNVEELPFYFVNGKAIIQLTNKVPLRDEDDNIIGVVGISIDITKRKEMEEELRHAKEAAEAANKAQTEFLENMRHDVRTPLVGIIGFSELIKSEVDDLKTKEYADNLVASSHALLDFLNEILEAVRVASGEIPLLKKKFDLKARLENIVKLNQAKASEKRLSLQFSYDDNIPSYLIGDPIRMQRIMLELIANALNFTSKGYVKVAATLAEKENKNVIIKLSVEDSGIGIPVDKHADIFTRFKRITPSYEGIYKGAGLGLSIVKQFIDELDAEIYVTSKPNEGAIFTCIFPLKESLLDEPFGVESINNQDLVSFAPVLPSKVTVPQVRESIGDNLIKILLIEDHPLAAQIAQSILSQLKCHVDIAVNGKTAIRKAHDNHYDLIFMDVGLPDVNGYDVTKRIRLNELNEGKHIPIVALTAHVDKESKENCIGVGMNAVLSKPLVKEKAQEILDAFFPERGKKELESLKDESMESDLFILPEKIMDIDAGKEIMNGDENLFKEMIGMLVNSLPEELDKLNQAYQQGDWETIGAIAHKLAGSASYCATHRLKGACSNLEKHLRKGNKELADKLYTQLLNEIEAVQRVCQSNELI